MVVRSSSTLFPPPLIDYVGRLRQRSLEPSSSPLLFLAPMENLADRPFRRSLHDVVGGFDEACHEFMRIPRASANPRGAVVGVTAKYDAYELTHTPLGAQVMGSDPELLALAAAYLAHEKHAPRVDLNCGCPANTVTGNGAGSSLLRTPDALGAIVRSMVAAVGGAVPVSVKMRSGFDDTSLMEDNLLAAQEAGAAFITLHARTKRQSYTGRADWSLIARAKALLRIPVVGNGDVVSVAAARALVAETGCDGIMVGRGAVQDPFLFHRIRASFEGSAWSVDEPVGVQQFLRSLFKASSRASRHEGAAAAAAASDGLSAGDTPAAMPEGAAARMGLLKRVMRYLFTGQPALWAASEVLLRRTPAHCSAEELLDEMCGQVQLHWSVSGPTQYRLVDHFPQQQQNQQVPATGAGAG